MKEDTCKTCKETLDFKLHKCKKGIQEYYGCKKCDDWCVACRPDWNNELNNNVELRKSKESKKSKASSKNLQKKQQQLNKKVKKEK